MEQDGLQRRDLLHAGGVAVTALAIGGSMTLDPGHARAMTTSGLDPHTAQTLQVMAHDLFPHKRLDEQDYARVVVVLDQQAASDAALRQLLTDGVAQLDRANGNPWIELPDSAREAVLRGMEKTTFFITVRTKTITGLYGNPAVYQKFGYGGPSAPLGGYIDRGFNDIDWLPRG
jgi:hypothetical protein